jgi:peptidoglycan/xylan/chitin deacetylase (PgdA/CDA1 family)
MEGSLGKKIAVITIVIFAAIIAYILFNTFFISKDYLYGPPLRFIKNRYISIDIYPHGYESATIFTNNYIEGSTPPEDIGILRLFLKKRDIKGVFFIIPNFIKTHPLSKNPLVIAELVRLKEDGHEIAQAGTYHTYGPDMARGAEPGQELLTLSFDEQLERVRVGRKFLIKLGFPPVGFRAPSFSTNEETFRVLESLDYLYDSSSVAPPRTFSTLLRPSLSQGLLYPYHPSGFEILEFTDYVDPTRRYAKAVSLFKRVTDQNGVFVYHTFIGNVAKPERLQMLDTFLGVVKNENTWCCTMSELTEWWQAREKLRVETEKDGSVFRITMENRTPFPLPEFGLKLNMTPLGVTEYVVMDLLDNVLAKGKLPARKKVFISLPGNPES